MRNGKKLRTAILVMLACLAPGTGVVFAQSAPASQQSATPTPTPAPSPSSESQDPGVVLQPVSGGTGPYSVSLGTGQLIGVGPEGNTEFAGGAGLAHGQAAEFKNLFYYGTSASTVYSNALDPAHPQDYVFSSSFSPYLAVVMPTRTGSFVAQYTATVNPNDTANGDPQAFHVANLKLQGAFTRRWSWQLQTSGSYGSESARFQAPLNYVVVQSTPVVSSNSAILLRTTNSSYGESDVHLGWRASSRDDMGWTFRHTYTGIAGDPGDPQSSGTHSNSVGLRMDYGRTLNSRVVMTLYGEGDSLLDGPTCNSIGGGVGFAVKVSHSVALDVGGGPQRNSNSCGGQQNYNFNGNLVANVRWRTRLFVSAQRLFSTAYRTDGVWEDNASAGFSKDFKRLNVTTDAGWVRGEPFLGTTQRYDGYFVSPRIRIRATEALALTAGYRSFHATGGAIVSGNESFAVAGIEWYPAGVHFK
ncbi:MAG TPA: hypothetical protein VE783_09070 [Candidatus Limnocylindrales bacterium]|nr:hypothetical protein [Candidatus Limnocylindrales bacterium]